jgi:hypothetical protein
MLNMLKYARIFAYRTDMNLIGRDGRTDGRDGRTDAQTTLIGVGRTGSRSGFSGATIGALTSFEKQGLRDFVLLRL